MQITKRENDFDIEVHGTAITFRFLSVRAWKDMYAEIGKAMECADVDQQNELCFAAIQRAMVNPADLADVLFQREFDEFTAAFINTQTGK